MSNVGVHDFTIPHEYVAPTRDMIVIQMPGVPRMVGRIHIPDMFRDMAKHNVAAGRVVSMGPLAFWYKAGDGEMKHHDVKIGDWVTIRPFAGTHVQAGKLQVGAGYRYVSSFQDVIGIIPADKMPDPSTLIWDDEDETVKAATPAATPEVFGGQPRETVKAEPTYDPSKSLMPAGQCSEAENACTQDEGA